MKEKITVAIVTIFCVGMYWISRTSNITSSNDSLISEEIPQIIEDQTIDYIDFETPESTLTDKAVFKLEHQEIKRCTLESKETDVLTFGKAFEYYRDCLGSDNNFTWNGSEYTTLLSDELIIQVVDTITVDEKSETIGILDIR